MGFFGIGEAITQVGTKAVDATCSSMSNSIGV